MLVATCFICVGSPLRGSVWSPPFQKTICSLQSTGSNEPRQTKNLALTGTTQGVKILSGGHDGTQPRGSFSNTCLLSVPGLIPDSFLFDDSLIVPIFQTGKLRHGETKLNNLFTMRLLVQGRSGVPAGAQGLELLLADRAALRG